MKRTILFISSALTLGACGAGTSLPPDSECTRGVKESDLVQAPWQGPGAVDGGLPASTNEVVVSTTFLALKPDADSSALFQQLFAGVAADLQTREGLVAYSVATSTRCNTARTLSVWADEAHMFKFATASAHGKAAAKVGSLSRGNSAVTHWHDTTNNVSFETAFTKLGAADAPF